jgi:hypothetical protein
MDPDNTTAAAVPEGSQLNPAGAAATVAPAPVTAPEGLTLAELNEHLGKQFPNRDSALKALKDTFSYVGKKKEDIEKEVRASVQQNDGIERLSKELEVERRERFYDKNPQFADPSIRKIIESTGKSPQEVVNSEEFKTVFNKVSEYDKSQKLRTVLESNPRLATSKDNLSKARELQEAAFKTGNYQGRPKEEVDRLAVDAVKEAYEM